MSKELWFQEFERLYNAAEERFGKVPNSVYDKLGAKADKAYRDRLADMADAWSDEDDIPVNIYGETDEDR